MGPWSKLDEFRRRVAASPIIELSADTLEEAQHAVVKSGFAPDRIVVYGWEILLSRRRQKGVLLWHLSAKLHPHSRASIEEDWNVLGRIAARMGAPRDPTIMPDDPHAPIHWSWIDDGS